MFTDFRKRQNLRKNCEKFGASIFDFNNVNSELKFLNNVTKEHKINFGKDTLGVLSKFLIYFRIRPKRINTFKIKLKIVNLFFIKFFISFLAEPFKIYCENFVKTYNEQNRKQVNENIENPLNFYMKTQPLYPPSVSYEPPPIVSSEDHGAEDSENMEINHEFNIEVLEKDEEEPNEEENFKEKEEEKGDFQMENEIENTIFSKPFVSKMNANSLSQGESKKESNKVESPKIIEVNLKEEMNQQMENKPEEHEESIHDKKIERKMKRRMSRDDAGVEYNQNPLDYLFPKEKEKITDSPGKKIPKECEDVELKKHPHPRNPELSKSFSNSASEKKEEEHVRIKNPLSTSVILDNKKYKVVMRKMMIRPGWIFCLFEINYL